MRDQINNRHENHIDTIIINIKNKNIKELNKNYKINP